MEVGIKETVQGGAGDRESTAISGQVLLDALRSPAGVIEMQNRAYAVRWKGAGANPAVNLKFYAFDGTNVSPSANVLKAIPDGEHKDFVVRRNGFYQFILTNLPAGKTCEVMIGV